MRKHAGILDIFARPSPVEDWAAPAEQFWKNAPLRQGGDMPALMQLLYDLSCSKPSTLFGRETRRIANRLRTALARRYDPIVKARIDNFELRVHASNANPVRFAEEYYTDGPIDRSLHFLKERRGDALSLIDIGANVGFTARRAHSIAPRSSFLLIEGDPLSFNLLEQNTTTIERRTLRKALMGERDEAVEGEFLQASGTASFVRHGLTAISERATAFKPERQQHRKVTLDTLVDELGIKTVDYLKIDTDGAEGKIIEGSARTLRTCRPVVVCEFNPVAMVYKGFETDPLRLFKLFAEQGHTLFAFYDQPGHLIMPADYEQAPEVFNYLTSYCTGSIAVMDLVVFSREQRKEFHEFVEGEQARARARLDKYLKTYHWR